MRTLVLAMAILVVTASVASAQQGKVPCPLPRAYVNELDPITVPNLPSAPIRVDLTKDHVLTSLATKGDEIDGPRRVVLLYVNRLRYSFSGSVDVTIIQNPALPAGFTATELAKAAPTTPGGGGGVDQPNRPRGFDGTFESIRECVATYVAGVSEVDDEQRTRSADIRGAAAEIESILKDSPAVLSRTEAESLRTRVATASAQDGSLRKSLAAPYPSEHAKVVSDAIDAFSTILAGLEGTTEYKDWSKIEGNLPKYLEQKALLTQGKATLQTFLPGKPADTEAIASQKKTAFWLVRFVEFSRFKIGEKVGNQPDVTDEDLALAIDTNCRTILGRGKSSAVSFSATDLFASSNQTVTGAVKAVCQPVLSVSSGLALTWLGDQTPAIISSRLDPVPPATDPGVVDKLGYTDKSGSKPLFMVQANFRLSPARKGWYPIATIGIGATSRTATTVVEYLFGGGVSVGGVVFISGGLHVGKQSRLGGGFLEGDVKPASLSAVPIDNGYHQSFSISITFPIGR